MTVVYCEIGETHDEGLQRYNAEHGDDSVCEDDRVIVVSFVSPGEASVITDLLVIENGQAK